MNYRRGLFRLWVILAVLWIGGVAFVSGPGVYDAFQERWWEKAPLAEPTKGPWQEYQRPELPPLPPGYKLDARDPRSFLIRAASLAFLPPLALLGLGAALVWAFSGFRHRA